MQYLALLNNDIYTLVLIFLYSFFATWISSEYFIPKLIKFGYVAQDKYKKDKPKIATMGGLAIFTGIMVALALSVLLMQDNGHMTGLFVFYFIVLVYGLYGVVDDLFSFKQRYDKILILLVLSLPIGLLTTHTAVNLLFTYIELGSLLPYLLAPIYVMVVANLINVYSGFNGLSSGLSLIMLLAITIKSFMLYGTQNLIFSLPILGAVIAFFPNVFFPAKALEGNIGQFMMGAAIGGLLIINQLELFGVIILIPHIINFLMDTIVLGIMKIPDVKFGSVRKDDTIIAPESVRFKSLKFLLTYYVKLKEDQATLILYIPTIIFCIIAILVI